MKLLVQGDDYGFTRGVTLGILDAIDYGVLTCTGLFANMPSTEFAVEEMKKRPEVCFGIDFNLVSGRPVCAPEEVPHLVDESGDFIRSTERVRDARWKNEEGRAEMFPFEEVYKEMRAQYDRFVRLMGKKPEYVHGHSIHPENYDAAMKQISEEEDVPNSNELQRKYGFGYAKFIPGVPKEKEKNFNAEAQLMKNPAKFFFEHEDYYLGKEYAALGGHPGYVDAELVEMTTLSLERMRDLQFYTSEELKSWIQKNGVELISYRDLIGA
ncbi:MAG: ChbG/HpnK family deacetylase [Lachnospiraceae bacterium]|nr:ChbG/HpnK family deacetylase [Lachnospiraceae bacterium]